MAMAHWQAKAAVWFGGQNACRHCHCRTDALQATLESQETRRMTKSE